MVLLTTLCGGCKKHSNSVSGLFVFAKETGKTDSGEKTYEYLGSCCLRVGDVKKALEFYQQCLSIPKETAEKQREGLVYGYLGRAYTSLGDLKIAFEFLQHALRVGIKTGSKPAENIAYNERRWNSFPEISQRLFQS